MGDQVSAALKIYGIEKEAIGLAQLPILGRVAKHVSSALAKSPNIKELGKRVLNPTRGWTAMTPAKALKEAPELVPHLTEALAKQTPEAGFLRRTFGAGKHLEATSPGSPWQIASGKAALPENAGRVKSVAEELSRRGWTGAGRVTKYIPLGDKGQIALGTAAAAPSLVAAAKDPEQGRLGEQLAGTAAGTGLGILTAGTGLPGLATSIGGALVAGRFGSRLDAARAQRRSAKLEELRGGPVPRHTLLVPHGQEPTLSNIRAIPEEPTNV